MSKKARSGGARVAGLIKANKAEFYIADVELEDETNNVMAAAEVVNKTLGKHKASFLLISAGVKCLTVVASVPSDVNKINSKEWLNEAVKNISSGGSGDGPDNDPDNDLSDGPNRTYLEDKYLGVVITVDTPFKLKDIARSSGFSYLHKCGCMGEEESSEEFVGFDDI